MEIRAANLLWLCVVEELAYTPPTRIDTPPTQTRVARGKRRPPGGGGSLVLVGMSMLTGGSLACGPVCTCGPCLLLVKLARSVLPKYIAYPVRGVLWLDNRVHDRLPLFLCTLSRQSLVGDLILFLKNNMCFWVWCCTCVVVCVVLYTWCWTRLHVEIRTNSADLLV
eukprot:jgi/Botrbrau1/20327/Bobra.0006s0009.1